MIARRLLAALLVAGALATPALAQDDRRVSDLQRQVKELRAIVFQGRDTGQPVEVKPVGPDPQVVALTARFDQLAEQARGMIGQNEVMQHDLEETRRTAEQNRAEATAFRQAAEARIAKLEAQLSASQPASAPPPPPPEAAAALPPATLPPSNRPPVSGRGAALTARTQAGDTSRFGDAAPPAAAGAADPFADAYGRFVGADYAGAQAGFEGYIARNPSGARTPEARYYLGQSLYMRETYAPAARAYAESLRGWPKTKWAPDATVRLAQSLAEINQAASACAALSEFSRRYGAAAPAAVRARAVATRGRAACAAG